MLLTIFKYLWIFPLAIPYIVWTIKAVKALVRLIIDIKRYKKVSFMSDDYTAFYVWIITHLILVFRASFTYFIMEMPI